MMEIIPAIDIIDGKCVRLEKGDYSKKKVYSNNPLEVARMFESWGFRRLHLVDLDGAKASHLINHKILNDIATRTSLVIDFGGGIKSNEDIRIAFENGASMVSCGSIAVKEPQTVFKWMEDYGTDKLILGADHRNEKVAVSGWVENSEYDLLKLIEIYYNAGIRKVISTDIEKDGMLKGVSIGIYKKILKTFKEVFLIASGGVSSTDDIRNLNSAGLNAVIIGKAIYEGHINEKNIKHFI